MKEMVDSLIKERETEIKKKNRKDQLSRVISVSRAWTSPVK
jgi:hypothetical protein